MLTKFERIPRTLQEAMCSRYRYYTLPGAVVPLGSGYATSTTNFRVFIPLHAKLRLTTPTIAGEVAQMRCFSGSSSFTPSAIALVVATGDCVAIDLTVTGATADAPCVFALTSTGSLLLDAEL